ncbi:MAG: 1-acyl-sn-glycerol-3-phosphate acyltransferase [Pseudomonadota bacterium]|nr:1-acyl-sn-glycerol-3-phosphate acyltransferase [Pseudomonadota bacterium]
MLLHNFKNNFIGSYLISTWIVNLQLIYLSSLFIFQNDWLNCYILLFFYCLFGQLPVKPKIPSWVNPVCMIVTTVSLFLNLPFFAASTLLFSHWLQGEQPIKPKLIGLNILLIQNVFVTFITLSLAHLLSLKTRFRPHRQIKYKMRFFKPLWILLFDQLFIVAALTISVWVYIISLPTLEPNDLIFALLPSCFIAYLVNENKKYIEPFLWSGYISLYISLAFFSGLINLFMLPHLEAWLTNPSKLNFCYLVLQQIVQSTLIGSLLASFNIQLTVYKTLACKKQTEGFHFVYSMSNIITIILLSIWVTHQQDVFLIANWLTLYIFIGLIITILRYPAALIKASLKSFVTYAFRIEMCGMHHLEHVKKPFIVIPNHNSYIEPPILGGMLPGRFMFPINPEASNMLAVRLTEAFWQKLPMSPNKPMMLKPFITGLKHGKVGIIFPEGQRSPIGKIGKIYPGANFAAQLTQSTLIPVYIDGSQYHLSSRMKSNFKKALFPKITIQIGQPFKVTKESRINEVEMRQLLVNTQCMMSHPLHISEAIDKLVNYIGDAHQCLFFNKKRFTLKQVLKFAKQTTWQHRKFYHVTNENFTPVRFLSALLQNIPIIYGDITKVLSPQDALYHVNSDKVISFTMSEIMTTLYQWSYNAPIYSETNLFVACDYDDYRIILFGFLGAILNGSVCILPDNKSAISQQIYLEHATALMTNKNYFEQLRKDATSEELNFIRHTITPKISSSNKKLWQDKFLQPVYEFNHNESNLLTSYETPFGMTYIAIPEQKK